MEKKKMLVVVDMVNGFINEGAMADKNIASIIPEQIRLIEEFKKEGYEIVFIKESHNADSKEFLKFPPHCIEGTSEAEIVDEFKPYLDDATIYSKNSTSGIFADGFIEDFNERFASVDEVVVTGCCTDICITNFALPLTNYADQNDRELKVVVPANAVSTYDAPNHDKDEYTKKAFDLLAQAGIQVVERYEEELKEYIENHDEVEVKKLIDFYELTMAYSDFLDGKTEDKCYFDVFFRKNLDNGGYNIACGLDEIIELIENFKFTKDDIEYLRSLGKFSDEFLDYLKDFKFTGDIYAIPDGTPIFPNEPCITVVGNSIEAKIIETDLLNRFNHGSMIATKTRRIVNEAGDRPVMEFGARRAQGDTAAVVGAKNAYIAGACGTSCYETGKKYGVPLLGTMAHSMVMQEEDEVKAFTKYAKAFPGSSTFLVDTYDTLGSGVPSAIKVAKDYLIPNGNRLAGIRLDSGDLAYLSKEARRMMDEAGLQDAKICASNSLDEYLIRDLIQQGAPIDSFGVGENLITSKNCPVFGGVYKLSAIENENGEIIPKIKISSTSEKTTNPGYKKVYRFIDRKTGYAKGDVIALADEVIDPDTYTLVSDKEPWKRTTLTDYDLVELQKPIFIGGKRVYKEETIKEKRAYADEQIKTLYPEIMRLNNPHEYYVDLSETLAALKREMIEDTQREVVKKKLNFTDSDYEELKVLTDEVAINEFGEEIILDEEIDIEDINLDDIEREE